MAVSLSSGFQLGIVIGDITRQLQKLEQIIDLSLLKHQIKEVSPIEKDFLKKNKEELIEQIKPMVNHLNRHIKYLNECLTILKIENKASILNFQYLKRILNDRFNLILEEDHYKYLGNENFKIKLHNIFSKIMKSVHEVLVFVEKDEELQDISKIERKYKKGVIEANDIRSIGYPLTSIFVIGRTIESILDDILKKAIKENKLKARINLRKTKYNDKINILKNLKIINEKLFHDINSIRIDRNETAHPIKIKNLKSESKTIIQKSVFLLKQLQRSI